MFSSSIFAGILPAIVLATLTAGSPVNPPPTYACTNPPALNEDPSGMRIGNFNWTFTHSPCLQSVANDIIPMLQAASDDAHKHACGQRLPQQYLFKGSWQAMLSVTSGKGVPIVYQDLEVAITTLMNHYKSDSANAWGAVGVMGRIYDASFQQNWDDNGSFFLEQTQ